MKRFILVAAVAVFTTLLTVWSANATVIVTVDFEGFGTGSFSNGIEDGVAISATGDNPKIFNNLSPFTSKSAVSNGSQGTTIWTFSLVSSGLFDFVSFDFALASCCSVPGANASIEGFLSAVSQGIDTYVATGIVVTEDALNLLAIPLDTLVITLNSRRVRALVSPRWII